MDKFDAEKEFAKLFTKCKNDNEEDVFDESGISSYVNNMSFQCVFDQCRWCEWSLHSYFTKDCLSLLLKQDYEDRPDLISDLFEYGDKDIMAVSDRLDLCVLYLKHNK